MEMFQLCDETGKPGGQASRSACHGNPSLIHMVVHLHVLDPLGRLYLQKRAPTKDTNPGRWDTAVGGHVSAGESPDQAVLREAREELGISAEGARPLFSFLYHAGDFETEYAFCYALSHEGRITPDPGEIAEGRFFTWKEIQDRVGSGVLTPMFEHELPMLKRALAVGV
jgi:isopentenyl-diphosphate delta-isomerase type 1